MNMRNLLIATTLALASGSAFAGKAPVVLGGFQTSGIVNTPRVLVEAVNDSKDEKREDKK
ncbi:MAG TPA: hypothetical protein VLI06_07165 [Solimonas sp.]|nr:hypothetical protein [Solimonas sp.]